MIALDTNLLVYAHRSISPEHIAARRVIEGALSPARGCAIPIFCITEFWAVATRATASGRASSEKRREHS